MTDVLKYLDGVKEGEELEFLKNEITKAMIADGLSESYSKARIELQTIENNIKLVKNEDRYILKLGDSINLLTFDDIKLAKATFIVMLIVMVLLSISKYHRFIQSFIDLYTVEKCFEGVEVNRDFKTFIQFLKETPTNEEVM